MIELFLSLSITAEIILGFALLVIGWILLIITVRTGFLLLEAGMTAGSAIIGITSNGIRDITVRVFGLVAGLIYLGVSGAFWPVRWLFNRLTVWVAARLSEAPEQGEKDPSLWKEMVSRTDDLVEARKVLGLHEGFSRADFDAQFRKLIRIGHPDSSGSPWLGQQIITARDEILKKRGWK